MEVEKLRRWAYAAIPGGAGLAVGVAYAVLEELQYNGIVANPIPDLVSFVVTGIGVVLLMIAFTSIRKTQIASGGTSGTVGYWIAMTGLLLSAAWVWPLFVLGPLLVGIGVSLYGASTLAAGTFRSFGSWLHVLCVPTAIVVGFASYAVGFDGGIGIIVFMGMVIAGFMTLGFDTAAPAERRMPREVAA